MKHIGKPTIAAFCLSFAAAAAANSLPTSCTTLGLIACPEPYDLISRGAILRGDTSAAGDIGHIHVTDDPSVLCRCGQFGCLEAVAGGWGLVRRLTPRAQESALLASRVSSGGEISALDLGLAAQSGDTWVLDEMLAGTRLVGETVGGLVNFVNPGTVVLGGGALRVGESVFEAFDDSVRSRTTKLAGQRLSTRKSSLSFQEGVVGGAILAVEQLFAPAYVGFWIEQGTPIGRAAPLQRAESVSFA